MEYLGQTKIDKKTSKKKIRKYKGGISLFVMGAAAAAVLAFITSYTLKRDEIRGRVFLTADTNHNYQLEKSELVKLANDLNLIKEGELISMDDIKGRVQAKCLFTKNLDELKEYLKNKEVVNHKPSKEYEEFKKLY